MVWFYCDDCGDTIKKPKLANHFRACHGHAFTCVDCSRSFDRASAAGHSTCVTEHEKYALGATKPGGFAAQGFYKDGAAAGGEGEGAGAGAAANGGSDEVVGLEFLSQRPPWRCSVCNVGCTSQETLLGHAAGAKHKRRARAAQKAAGGGGANGGEQQANGSNGAAAAAEEQKQQQQQQQGAADTAPVADAADANGHAAGKEKQQKKEKKQKKKDSAAASAASIEGFLKAAATKLKRRGKLGVSKLAALCRKHAAKEPGAGEVDDGVVVAVKAALLKQEGVRLNAGGSTLKWRGEA